MAQSSERIVICGAGIAGIAAAYHLTVRHGARDVALIEAENPLSMTSDKSTEAYRNWWPGPDAAMTQFMNRSIDFLEEIARETGNRINLNRRGYLFASGDPAKAQFLLDMAALAERHGAGPLRWHDTARDTYVPAPSEGFETPLSGADVITNRGLIARHFPYLAPETCVVAHARRAGWLSAQQLGMAMLERARENGLKLLRGRIAGIETAGGRISGVVVEGVDGKQALPADKLILCPGPMLKPLAARLGLDLPVFAERHRKISFADTLHVIPRAAPMLIWLDSQKLPWSEEEREILAGDPATRWLTEPFPGGVHGRPDGGASGSTVLLLYNYESREDEVVFPLPDPGPYGEIALRGMSTMVPGLKVYVAKGVRPYIDGGYYIKTRENRPLIGPTTIPGVFLSAAYSGFGIMASGAGGDLIARHVLEKELPPYASAFLLTRYEDRAYVARLADWGDGGQL